MIVKQKVSIFYMKKTPIRLEKCIEGARFNLAPSLAPS